MNEYNTKIDNDASPTTKSNYDSQRSKQGCGWPRWMPQMARTKGSHRPDCQHRLQAASRAFCATRNSLCNKAVKKRWHFFNKTITPVTCFAAGHKKFYKTDLDTMDVNFRRLLRSVVGPPAKQTGGTHATKFYMTRMLGSRGMFRRLAFRHGRRKAYNNTSIYARTLMVCLTLDPRWASRILVWRPRNVGNGGAQFWAQHSAAKTSWLWNELSWVELRCVGLSWVVQLGWVELSWIELSWVELSWACRRAGGASRAEAERNDINAKYVQDG